MLAYSLEAGGVDLKINNHAVVCNVGLSSFMQVKTINFLEGGSKCFICECVINSKPVL
jgi:hypothetical protein